MAITQISDKAQVKLRHDLTRPLEHSEGDGNFTQLENAIDDISNIINSLGLLDNIPSMIDEKTDKIATDLKNTSDDLTRRTQAAIDKINQSTAAITEIKRVSDITHRQLTYASSVYANEFGEYDERLLYGIIDTAIKRLRDTLQTDINNVKGSLHKVATTGNVEDTNGLLDFFTRLRNIPRWIRETHDDGGFLYIRSPDTTQFRLGNSYFDLFNDKGNVSFRVNSQTGYIETGAIDQKAVANLGQVARDNSYTSLINKPALGDVAWRNVFDTGDVNKIPWDGNTVPTTSVARALKDFTQNLKDSLKGIAYTGAINDATGVLDKAHGGRGRGDDNYDGQWFYANGSLTNCGYTFGGANNKLTNGDDNGDDLSKSGNINIDTWNGFGIRSSINSFITTWKHDARSGNTRQRGDMILDGSSGERGIRCDTNWMHLTAPSADVRVGFGNFEFYHDGTKVHFVDGDGSGWFKGHMTSDSWGWFGGALTTKGKLWADGGIQVKGLIEFNTGLEIKTGTPYIDFRWNNSDNDFTTRIIQDSEAMLSIYGGGLTIERELWVRGGKINGHTIGDAIERWVFDQASLSITDIPYGNGGVPSVGALRICMDNLAWAWGRHIYDDINAWYIAGNSQEIPTTNTLVAVRNYLQEQINDRVTDMRWVKVINNEYWKNSQDYGANSGEVITRLYVRGGFDFQDERISVSVLQFYKNGQWRTVYN